MSSSRQDWRRIALGEIAKVTSGGTPSRKELSYWNGDVPWVSTSLIDFNVITSTKEHITVAGVNHSSAKVFPKGTLLMAMFGQGVTRGKVAVLGIDATFNQACVAITPSKEADTGYLYQFLAHSYEAIRQLSNSGSQENLNAGLIKGIQLPLPPLSEQKRIAEVVSTRDRGIRQLTDLISVKSHVRNGLIQNIMVRGLRFQRHSKTDHAYVQIGEVMD
jgi:type I restriction enzyme S subunit